MWAIGGCFAEAFERSGLSMREAVDELGVSERQIKRYLADGCRVPKLVVERVRELARLRTVRKPPRDPSSTWFRFIDLFAGIGGLRIGFEEIGGRCVFTSEWDKWSQKTYAHNFPHEEGHELVGDIRPYGEVPERLPRFDVLLAGFPCQPFSLAGVSKKNSLGRKHGFDDVHQGNLFFDIARILDHHRPAAFLLENVKHLQRHDGGRTFEIIRRTLQEDLGYKIDCRIISSEPWVPQRRERIFIAGFREDVGFDFGGFHQMIPPECEWPKLGSVLQSHNEVDSKYTLTPHLWNYLQEYRRKHERQGNGFGYSLFGPDDVARTLSARYHKDGSEILIDQPGMRPRRLTPVECSRLMGFEHGDRRFEIPRGVSDTQAYRQFGNAVAVPVVSAIAEYLRGPLEEMIARDRAIRVSRPPAERKVA
jgi:DNA (cytosine-5)-methyltransferase 1